MEERKETFIFYTDWEQYLNNLEPSDVKELISIICEYVKNLKEPKKPILSDRLLMVWLFIKTQLDKDKTKYDKRCQTSRINGLKGGRPKNLKNLNKSKKADNDNEHDNEHDNDNINNNFLDTTTTTNIYNVIESNFGRTLSPVEYETIESWLSLFKEEIINHAVEIAVLNNKKTFNYVNGILNNWNACGYKTLQEIKDQENKLKRTSQKIDENKKELFDYDWLNDSGEG